MQIKYSLRYCDWNGMETPKESFPGMQHQQVASMHVSMVFIITVCVLIMFCLCKTVKINGHHVLIMFDGEGISKKRWVERLCKLSKGILDIPFGKPN